MPTIQKPIGGGRTETVEFTAGPYHIYDGKVTYYSSDAGGNHECWTLSQLKDDRFHVLGSRTAPSGSPSGRMSVEEMKIRLNNCSPSVSRALFCRRIIDTEYPEDVCLVNRLYRKNTSQARAKSKTLGVFLEKIHENSMCWVGQLDGDLFYARSVIETLCRNGEILEDQKKDIISGLQMLGYGVENKLRPVKRSSENQLHTRAQEVFDRLNLESRAPSLVKISDALINLDNSCDESEIRSLLGLDRVSMDNIKNTYAWLLQGF